MRFKFASALAASAAFVPYLAQADGLSYSYLDAAYLNTDVDQYDDTVDGFGVRGSYELTDNVFVFAGYADQGTSVAGIDIDLQSYNFGLGYAWPLAKALDLYGKVGYVNAKADVDGFGSAGFVRTLMPELLDAIQRIVDVWDTPDREDTIIRIWEGLPESTIDQGIMERADRVAVVPADIGWSDVGDWHGLGELIEQDSVGNSVRADIVQVETRRSVVWSETGRLVALIGLENVVVVDTEDALMVIDRNRSQDVKKIVGELKRLSRHELS